MTASNPAGAGMDQALRTAIALAVTRHEIGHGDPYRLSFAGKGKSGASFGTMQGDVSVEPLARETLRQILAAARIGSPKIEAILTALAGPLPSNPLRPEDDALVEAALAAPAGRQLIDRMDRQLLARLLAMVEDCIAAAATAHRQIERAALLCIALWINMSGPPTTLKRWLAGNEVWLDHRGTHLAAPGAVVTVADVEDYVKATSYFSANPGNFTTLQLMVAAARPHLA